MHGTRSVQSMRRFGEDNVRKLLLCRRSIGGTMDCIIETFVVWLMVGEQNWLTALSDYGLY